MGVARLLPLLVGETAAGEASLGALEPRLGQADEARVGHRLALRVGEIRRNAPVDPCHRACGDMLAAPLHLEDELSRVAICSPHQSHPRDLLTGEGGQLPRADEPYLPAAAAVAERETLALPVELPAGLLVLD